MSSDDIEARQALHALYCQLGIPVFPAIVDEKGKRGRIGIKSPLYNGQRWSSTTDPALLADYWRRWPRDATGLATGQRMVDGRRLLVLDLDTARGKRASGLRTFTDLLMEAAPKSADMRPKFPFTPMVRTRSGGLHILLSTEYEYKSISDWLPGIDIRASGGMVIAPPTSGYTALTGPGTVPIGPGAIRPAPAWLIARLPPLLPRVAGTAATPLPPPAGFGDMLEADAAAFPTIVKMGDTWNKPSETLLRRALMYVPPDLTYNDWLLVGLCLHEWAEGGKVGLRIWDDWSKGSQAKYKVGECAKRWNTFMDKRNDAANIGSLLRMAYRSCPVNERNELIKLGNSEEIAPW